MSYVRDTHATHGLLTSELAAVLQVVDALSYVALAQFLSNKPCHHSTDPLLADDGILGSLEGLGVVEIDAVEGGSDLGLLALEELGLGGRHSEDYRVYGL